MFLYPFRILKIYLEVVFFSIKPPMKGIICFKHKSTCSVLKYPKVLTLVIECTTQDKYGGTKMAWRDLWSRLLP